MLKGSCVCDTCYAHGVSEFLDRQRQVIAERLSQLEPLVEEYARLKAAHQVLAVGSAPAGQAGLSPGSVEHVSTLAEILVAPAPRASSSSMSRRRTRGRPPGSGPRANQALALVREHPGITVGELAERMDMKQNYLYRVMPRLARDGFIQKQADGWYPSEIVAR